MKSPPRAKDVTLREKHEHSGEAACRAPPKTLIRNGTTEDQCSNPERAQGVARQSEEAHAVAGIAIANRVNSPEYSTNEHQHDQHAGTRSKPPGHQ